MLPNQVEMSLQRRAMVGPKFENGQTPAREILLIAQIFIANDKQIKTG